MDSEISTGNKDNHNSNDNNAGTLWFDQSTLGPIVDNEITDDEILRYINQKIDSDCFTIRNLTSLKTEDDTQRLRKYQYRLTELLSKK